MMMNIFEKAIRFNEAMMEQFIKASQIQMNAFQRYSEMAMSQMSKVSEVRDAGGLKDMTAEQTETLKDLNEQFRADMQTWRDYSNEAREQIQKAIAGAPEAARSDAAELVDSAESATWQNKAGSQQKGLQKGQ